VTLLRYDHVGSLVRPAALLQAFDDFEDGKLDAAAFRAEADGHITTAVALQEDIGLRAVTDGEFRRRSYSRSIFEAVEGIAQKRGLFSFRNEQGATVPVNAGYVAGRMRRKRPIVAEDIGFLASITSRTAKATLLSPTYFHFGLFGQSWSRDAYADFDAYWSDLARIYIEELKDLAAAGCRHVQLDEVPLAMICDPDNQEITRKAGEDPGRVIDRYVELLNAICRARPSGMTVCVHLCRGNRVGMWAAAGGYEPVAERLFNQVEADAYLLEFDTERAGGLEPLRHLPKGKRALLGFVSTKRREIESADELKRKLDLASRHVSIDQLGLCPQCGFGASALRGSAGQNPMTVEIQEAKLRRMVEVAREVWPDA
jgi:5-methyltetrahydropteroyltriglutamate--homocysteine methyltransferase